jgi:hypothetical protein
MRSQGKFGSYFYLSVNGKLMIANCSHQGKFGAGVDVSKTFCELFFEDIGIVSGA